MNIPEIPQKDTKTNPFPALCKIVASLGDVLLFGHVDEPCSQLVALEVHLVFELRLLILLFVLAFNGLEEVL